VCCLYLHRREKQTVAVSYCEPASNVWVIHLNITMYQGVKIPLPVVFVWPCLPTNASQKIWSLLLCKSLVEGSMRPHRWFTVRCVLWGTKHCCRCCCRWEDVVTCTPSFPTQPVQILNCWTPPKCREMYFAQSEIIPKIPWTQQLTLAARLLLDFQNRVSLCWTGHFYPWWQVRPGFPKIYFLEKPLVLAGSAFYRLVVQPAVWRQALRKLILHYELVTAVLCRSLE